MAYKHLDDGRNTDQECDLIFFHIFQSKKTLECFHNDDRGAGIEGWARASGVDAAAVEPRSRIDGDVVRIHREVHQDIMCAHYLVGMEYRNPFWLSGRAGSIKTHCFIIHIRNIVCNRLTFRIAVQKIRKT